MIQINLLIPPEFANLVDLTESESFKIIDMAKHMKNNKSFYVVETTEEELVFLTLKLGSNNVWRRW